MKKHRPILTKGEAYTKPVVRKNAPPGDKAMPYIYSVARQRFMSRVRKTLESAKEVPFDATPDGQIVTKLTLHPSFLAKSYFPEKLLEKYDLKNLGSKEVFVSPENRATKEQNKLDIISTSMYFLSGSVNSINLLAKNLADDDFDDDIRNEILALEDFSIFTPEEKVLAPNEFFSNKSLNFYEIVLHAALEDNNITESFFSYVSKIGGDVIRNKVRTIKGLTFVFASVPTSAIKTLATFSFVRVIRPVPEMNLEIDQSLHVNGNVVSALKSLNSRDSESNIAIFDAGLSSKDNLNGLVRYFDLTGQETDIEDNLLHGSLVTSALVYGEVSSYDAPELLSVDHFKVYSAVDSHDIGLVQVLDRIAAVLVSGKYKFANISLGPRFPCPDSEPSLWTSTLDEIASKGNILIVVAVGNDGIYLGTDLHFLARIQPPADILNGISIGAANSKNTSWKRASYSCIGPGRRPGFVKPDALYFGGDQDDKLRLYSLEDFSIKEVMGTSFAAPLVTRLAALLDAHTGGELSVASIRALLIHSTGKNDSDRIECGWGRINPNLDNILLCKENSATVIYQGLLDSASGVRAAIPFPSALEVNGGYVSIDATVCFYTDIDQQHTVSYTRAGLEITFRPDFDKFVGDAKEAKTRSLFNKSNIVGNEQSLRRDAHKWETCYKVHDRLHISSLSEPIFDIRYLTRDEGHARSASEMRKLEPLSYSLVVTISTEQDSDLYMAITNEYNLLVPIDVRINTIVDV